jgi:hypothetical protein
MVSPRLVYGDSDDPVSLDRARLRTVAMSFTECSIPIDTGTQCAEIVAVQFHRFFTMNLVEFCSTRFAIEHPSAMVVPLSIRIIASCASTFLALIQEHGFLPWFVYGDSDDPV